MQREMWGSCTNESDLLVDKVPCVGIMWYCVCTPT
jgi:hypothetical protein